MSCIAEDRPEGGRWASRGRPNCWVVAIRAGRRLLHRLGNWFWRLAYWFGFRLARLWWWLRRPDHHGAVVAIWLGRRILVVHQSYRSNLSWPGGGIRRGESPRDPAVRELAEELGLMVRPDDLVLAHEAVFMWDYRRDRVCIFELRIREASAISIDGREIVAAHFVEPATLLAMDDLPPFIRAYLTAKVPDPPD